MYWSRNCLITMPLTQTNVYRFSTRTPLVLLIVLVLMSVRGGSGEEEECQLTPGSTCSWKCASSGLTFDLQNLAKPNPPLFKDVPVTKGTSNDTYSYDPCGTFTSKPPCKNVAICKHDVNKNVYVNVADQKDAIFTHNGDSNYISYGDDLPKSRVVVLCSTEEYKLEALGETQTGVYNFTLLTKYVCPASGGLSVGSMLLIIFFVLLLVYIIGGILYLRFAHGARGVEQIPNYDFWLEFPLLVKDGMVFLSKGCKNETTYEKI